MMFVIIFKVVIRHKDLHNGRQDVKYPIYQRYTMSRKNLALSLICLFLAACAGPTTQLASNKAEDAALGQYTPVSYIALPGWANDNQTATLAALKKSCDTMLKRPPQSAVVPSGIGGTIHDWTVPCTAVKTASNARTFFETYFNPYQIVTPNGSEGLFTGYYEKIVHGSRVKTAKYHVPIYKRPDDLVMVDLGDFRPDLKGTRIAGKVDGGKLIPYADRKQIDEGALENKHLELAWADDENAVFFLHVQGSGRVIFEDGSVMRIGYDGQNGFAYRAIGRELIARGELTPDNVSLDTIRDWLVAHPKEAAQLRWTNPSYIFFRVVEGDGPLGAQGVGLTPGHSLAVDPRFVPYGAPVFIDAAAPMPGQNRLQRLLVAQDTGGAIHGQDCHAAADGSVARYPAARGARPRQPRALSKQRSRHVHHRILRHPRCGAR